MCGPGQRELAELSAAAPGLRGQRAQGRGRAQVAGAVIEQLARHGARTLAVRGFRHRDPAGRLDDAVEAPPAAPRPAAAPRGQAHHHQPGMAFGQDVRGQPEAFQGVRAVPVHQDVGAGQQVVPPGVPLDGAEVEQRAALAGHAVIAVQGQFRPVRRVEPQDVRAEGGQVPGGHRAGDDAGQVKHPQARSGQRTGGPRTGRRAADPGSFDQPGRGDGLARRLRPPVRLAPDGSGDPARADHQVLRLPRGQ